MIFYYFCTVNWFTHSRVIKREPGENPGQSRCCKPPFRVQTTKATVLSIENGSWKIDDGKAFASGGKSEDLPLT
jgi:hypothetical protein